MKNKWRALLLLSVVMSIAIPAIARPKVCVVLSGGGARGSAHIGVLKVLEEYRVPVDCIVGTSMGSLVAGGYATGMSISEMEKINAKISTELLFKENPPRGELSMRRKRDDYTIFLGPEIGFIEGEPVFGQGLLSGVQLETVLRGISKVKGYQKFDDLPIPFRAVATNLVTGKPVVFSEGELANVMRASMSVPAIVSPAHVGEDILVDGMLTQNLPIETARAMGADVIIAVNVGTPLLKRSRLYKILGVTEQMLNILTEQNVQSSISILKSTDILISPKLGDTSTFDFDNLSKIVPMGEKAAREMGEQLSELSISANEYAALRQRQSVVVAPDLRPVDEIRFVKLDHVNSQSAQAVMRTQIKKPIDQQILDADMRRIYGTGDFEHVNYRFLEESGRRVLLVDAIEKSWGPDYLRFGLGLSSDFRGGAYFNVLASYRKTWLNRLGAEWRTDLQLGRTLILASEFYQPLNPRESLFVSPYIDVERNNAELFQGKDHIASYESWSGLMGIDVGSQFGQYGVLRIGVVAGELWPKLDIGPPSLSPGASRIQQGAFRVRVVLDQLDSVHFPRSGWRAGMNIFNSNDALGADNAYTKWSADGTVAFSFGENTFNFGFNAGGKIGGDPLPRYDMFSWGGFLEQSGYRDGQLYGGTLKFARAMYYRRILRGTLFEGAYAGFSLEAGKVEKPLVTTNSQALLKSASLFIAADTPLGPVYLGYGHSWDGNGNLYFYLGRPGY